MDWRSYNPPLATTAVLVFATICYYRLLQQQREIAWPTYRENGAPLIVRRSTRAHETQTASRYTPGGQRHHYKPARSSERRSTVDGSPDSAAGRVVLLRIQNRTPLPREVYYTINTQREGYCTVTARFGRDTWRHLANDDQLCDCSKFPTEAVTTVGASSSAAP